MGLTKKKSVVFITGTRADFGKLKPLIRAAEGISNIEVHVFVTGMHLMARYGYTAIEVEKEGFRNIHKLINQNTSDTMESVLAKTITGFSDFVKEISPDLIVIHGDRIEALAGAIVGALGNIITAHIEGGEVSGTIDESLRHSITKLAHIHLVCNDQAMTRLVQMGEGKDRIHVIGSPDLDVMRSASMPTKDDLRSRYGIDYERYGILIYHPVTTQLDTIDNKISQVLDAALESSDNYVVIYPNNDHGSATIINELKRLEGNDRFRIFPSLRFEYFLALLKNAEYIIGNSSAGVREAPFYGVPCVNLGTRQKNRAKSPMIVNAGEEKLEILAAIELARSMERSTSFEFGNGESVNKFRTLLESGALWDVSTQKFFNDL